MNHVVYYEKTEGFSIERLVRDEEYSMYLKHMHPEYELFYLMGGERYYFIENESYYITPGTLVLINRDEIHKTGTTKNPKHDRVLILMNSNWINPLLALANLPSIDTLIKCNRIIHFPESLHPFISSLMHSIYTELKEKNTGFEVLIKNRMLELLIYGMRYQKPQEESLKASGNILVSKDSMNLKNMAFPLSEKHRKVAEISHYIQEHYYENLTLSSIALHFYLHKGYVSRIFKDVTSFTVTEYIHIQRVKHAKELLESSNETITKIAEMTGYESIVYFEKTFKKYAGTAPLSYRKHHNHPA